MTSFPPCIFSWFYYTDPCSINDIEMDGSNTGSGECNYISESEYEDLGEDYNDDESDVDGEISNITEENDDVDNSDDDDGINNSDDGNSNDDASDSEGMANVKFW